MGIDCGATIAYGVVIENIASFFRLDEKEVYKYLDDLGLEYFSCGYFGYLVWMIYMGDIITVEWEETVPFDGTDLFVDEEERSKFINTLRSIGIDKDPQWHLTSFYG